VNAPTPDRGRDLRDLALVFLRLGTIAFGGPAAHVAMMDEEIVVRRGWLSRPEFLDLLGAANLIPGPNSTEMAIHVGYRRAGWAGLLVAGICFILPATLIVTAIAWLYVRFGHLPQIAGVLYGLKPVVIAIVLQALWRLGKNALRSVELALLAALAFGASTFGVHELVVLFGAGALAAALGAARTRRSDVRGFAVLPILPLAAATAAPFAMATMFLTFLKIGAVLFGSGYVLLAFLRNDFVVRFRWLTETQLLDAVAVGQFTPGPVFTTATFIGYLLGGTAGAVVATVGIFLPAFVFVALSAPLVSRIRSSPIAAAILDGVNVASLALMALVTLQLGHAALVDWTTVLLAGASAAALLRFRMNATWLLLGGAAVGLIAVLR
jgi:chromate transporter